MALHLYDPLAPDFYDPARRARRARPHVPHLQRLPRLREALPELQVAVRDDRRPRWHRACRRALARRSTSGSSTSATSASSATSSARTRRTSSRSGGSTSRSSCCARSSVQSREGKVVDERAAARAHRSARQGRDDARAGRERVDEREAGAVPHGEGHRHRARPAAADVRPVRFSKWFKRPDAERIAARAGAVALFPTCLVEYQEPGDRQGDGRRVRAQRVRVRPARGSDLLRDAVARRGRHREVPRARAAQRRRRSCPRSRPA